MSNTNTEKTTCAYCDMETTVRDEVPTWGDDEAWEGLSIDHLDDCEWVATRAHQQRTDGVPAVPSWYGSLDGDAPRFRRGIQKGPDGRPDYLLTTAQKERRIQLAKKQKAKEALQIQAARAAEAAFIAQSKDLWDHDTPASEHTEVPEWVGDSVTCADVAAIVQGGCASGAWMPAVTYYQAVATMSEHGDDVLQYLEDQLGELPQHASTESWSGIAVHYLSCAVELWASGAEAEICEALAELGEDEDTEVTL